MSSSPVHVPHPELRKVFRSKGKGVGGVVGWMVAGPVDCCCEQRTFDLCDVFRIKLRVPHEVAGGLAALRAGLEALVVEVAQEPENIRQMDQKKQRMLNLVRHVSKATTAGITLVTNTSR